MWRGVVRLSSPTLEQERYKAEIPLSTTSQSNRRNRHLALTECDSSCIELSLSSKGLKTRAMGEVQFNEQGILEQMAMNVNPEKLRPVLVRAQHSDGETLRIRECSQFREKPVIAQE